MKMIIALQVMAWACRLGSYLFVRIMKDGKDKRFDQVRSNPTRYINKSQKLLSSVLIPLYDGKAGMQILLSFDA